MSISGKHWYREQFLKSDEWKAFSAQVRAEYDGACYICGKKNWDNDVHHVWYGEPSYTGARQFVVLCRSCHDAVHSVFDPRAARVEGDKIEAWTVFMEFRKAFVFNNRKALKESDPDRKATRCRGCHRGPELTKWIEPITQTVYSHYHRNSMCLCDECFQLLKKSFERTEHGSALLWERVRFFLDSLPKKEFVDYTKNQVNFTVDKGVTSGFHTFEGSGLQWIEVNNFKP